MDEQINVDIRANDDASDTLDDVADKVAKLEDAPATELEVTADTAAAEADLRAIADEAERVAKLDARIKIEAEIDAAKGNIRELKRELDGLDSAGDGTTGGGATARLSDGMDDVVDKTGRAKDAVNGFAGEAVTQLPGVGAAIGPASEAVGQLTEGLLAGEIGMKGLAAAAGPLIGITLGIKLITDELARIDRVDAWHEERVEEYTEAIREAESALAALRTTLEDTETVEFLGGFGDQAGDATDSLAEFGLKIDDFVQLVAGGKPALDGFTESVAAANPELRSMLEALNDGEAGQAVFDTILEYGNPTLQAYAEVLLAARQAATDLTAAEIAAADITAVFGDRADDAAGSADNAATALGIMAGGARDAASGIDDTTSSFADLRAELADESSYLTVQNALDDLEQKASDAFYAAASGAEDADDKQRIYQQAVIDTKNKIIDYTDEVAKIPTTATTAIVAEVERASGDVSGLLALLDGVERTRRATIVVNTILTGGAAGASGSLYGP